jgi:hypothetical protein
MEFLPSPGTMEPNFALNGWGKCDRAGSRPVAQRLGEFPWLM